MSSKPLPGGYLEGVESGNAFHRAQIQNLNKACRHCGEKHRQILGTNPPISACPACDTTPEGGAL